MAVEPILDAMSARLTHLEDQIRNLKLMIREDLYCDHVIYHLAEVKADLNDVRQLLFEKHVKSCVAADLQQGNGSVVDELLLTMGRLL